jgi:hypothetical protein
MWSSNCSLPLAWRAPGVWLVWLAWGMDRLTPTPASIAPAAPPAGRRTTEQLSLASHHPELLFLLRCSFAAPQLIYAQQPAFLAPDHWQGFCRASALSLPCDLPFGVL